MKCERETMVTVPKNWLNFNEIIDKKKRKESEDAN